MIRMKTKALRLLLALACSATAILAGTPSSGAADEIFEVTAVPYFSIEATEGPCGVENVHHGRREIKATSNSLFVAEMTATGDWDLILLDDGGEVIAISARPGTPTQPTTEMLFARLVKGDAYTLYVCNYSSEQTTVTVRLRRLVSDTPTLKPKAKGFNAIRPGSKPDLRERVPVQFVFVGFTPKDLDVAAFKRELPARYRPLNRIPAAYGSPPPYLGIEYTYAYSTTFPDAAWQNRFFSRLTALGKPESPTGPQKDYNEQDKNALDITKNYAIDANAAEQWLSQNPPRGVNTQHNTVFFINWFGRKDFRFHVYRHFKERDPDTKHDPNRPAYQNYYDTVAWGGTAFDDPEHGLGKRYRVWFHDLSAGPDAFTMNGNVDSKDNAIVPPAWEYGRDRYKPRAALAPDLGKVARYAAINGMFTVSPIYPAAPAKPLIPSSVNLDVNTYDDNDELSVDDVLTSGDLLEPLKRLMPLTRVTLDVKAMPFRNNTQLFQCYTQQMTRPANQPAPGGAPDPAYSLAYGALSLTGLAFNAAPSCELGSPTSSWRNLPTYHSLRLGDLRDTKSVDYEAPQNLYLPSADVQTPPGGWADDNGIDGTQGMTFAHGPPWITKYFGATHIMTHEFGHHFSLSHPHDAYDYERGVDYSAYQPEYAYALLAGESATAMSYLTFSFSNDFSQFDYDNRQRWMTEGYLEQLNLIAASVFAKKPGAATLAALRSADGFAVRAAAAFTAHDYAAAERYGKAAYDTGVRAARQAGVRVDANLHGFDVPPPLAEAPTAPTASPPSASGSSKQAAALMRADIQYASTDLWRMGRYGLPEKIPGYPVPQRRRQAE